MPAARPKRILISGAGIAGPALAYWLNHYGHRVTLVERAPALRQGGQAVDLKGESHLKVLERMGILDAVRERETGKTDQFIVDRTGKRLATIPGELTGGDIEIVRGDLSEILYERTAPHCEYVFGDSITSLTQTDSRVQVTFEQGTPREFDLVIGADGVHSNVRRLALGPEENFVRHLGYYYATSSVSLAPGHARPNAHKPEKAARATGLMYNVPGRLANHNPSKSTMFFVFSSKTQGLDRQEIGAQKSALADAYADVGWSVPQLIDAIWDSPDFYLDSISRVEMDHYSSGRVALIGDAAYGNTLGGFGTGMSMVGAYVLAGEIAAAGGDHHRAFMGYQERLHAYTQIARTGSAGPHLAPPTRFKIWVRNQIFRYQATQNMMIRMANNNSTTDLPEYSQNRIDGLDATGDRSTR